MEEVRRAVEDESQGIEDGIEEEFAGRVKEEELTERVGAGVA